MKYENFRKEMIAVFDSNQAAVKVMTAIVAMISYDDVMGEDLDNYRFYHEIKTDGSRIDLNVFGELGGEEVFSLKFNLAR